MLQTALFIPLRFIKATRRGKGVPVTLGCFKNANAFCTISSRIGSEEEACDVVCGCDGAEEVLLGEGDTSVIGEGEIAMAGEGGGGGTEAEAMVYLGFDFHNSAIAFNTKCQALQPTAVSSLVP